MLVIATGMLRVMLIAILSSSLTSLASHTSEVLGSTQLNECPEGSVTDESGECQPVELGPGWCPVDQPIETCDFSTDEPPVQEPEQCPQGTFLSDFGVCESVVCSPPTIFDEASGECVLEECPPGVDLPGVCESVQPMPEEQKCFPEIEFDEVTGQTTVFMFDGATGECVPLQPQTESPP